MNDIHINIYLYILKSVLFRLFRNESSSISLIKYMTNNLDI